MSTLCVRTPRRSPALRALAATIEADWPSEEPDEFDDLELGEDPAAAGALWRDDPWSADDEYDEAYPEPGDFWFDDEEE